VKDIQKVHHLVEEDIQEVQAEEVLQEDILVVQGEDIQEVHHLAEEDIQEVLMKEEEETQ
jgi:hypothetical protein